MRSLKLIVTIVFSVFILVGHATNIFSEDREKKPKTDTTGIDYILFGIFCGECNAHCAIMFKFDMLGYTNLLFVDSSDSYFKNNGVISCKTPVHDNKKLNLANEVVRHIPSKLLTTKTKTETFGCPDCNDGCGIYFEFKQKEKIKKFYIDSQTEKLSKEIKTFSEYLIFTINRLKLNNHSKS